MKVKLFNQKRALEEVMANLDGSWWLRKNGETTIILEGRIFDVREQRQKHADAAQGVVTLESEDGIPFTAEEFHKLEMNRPLGRILKFQ